MKRLAIIVTLAPKEHVKDRAGSNPALVAWPPLPAKPKGYGWRITYKISMPVGRGYIYLIGTIGGKKIDFFKYYFNNTK